MNYKYKIFAHIFNFFKIFPFKIFKGEDVLFIVDKRSSFSGNPKFIKDELDKRGKFKYHYVSKEEYAFKPSKSFKKIAINLFSILNFFLIKSYKMAKSKYIFLNDNFFPLAYMNFSNDTVVVQLWHAPGAFKRFGISTTEDENIKYLVKSSASKVNYLTVSSKNVSDFYAEAFGIAKDKILSFGIPRIDYYFNKNYNNKNHIAILKEKFGESYPETKGKKLVLYAPTFRDDEKKNEEIAKHFDFEYFNDVLGDEYCLLFRSHPKINTSNIKHTIDLTSYGDVKELLLISDVLITDYSSIMIEYAILSKPIIFYPFDLDYYIANERGFYFSYCDVPGPIAIDTEDIVRLIKENNFDFEKIRKFVEKEYDYLDDKSSKRIVGHVLKNSDSSK